MRKGVWRAVSLGALLGSAAVASGCADIESTDPSGTTTETALPGPSEWNRDVTAPPDAEAADKRDSCEYKAGMLPAETQGESRPNGKEIPVEHVLVMMMENRSFDHYFQKLPEYGQPDVEVAPPDFANPGVDGEPVPIFHDTSYCFVDTNHGWGAVHQQVNGGAMDGFFATNEGHHDVPVNGTLDMISGARAMGYYDATDLPFYYWLANEFSIADHYHASVLGPTFPNRMYLYAASSLGNTYNTIAEADATLVDYLEERQIDWKIYATGTPGFAIFISTHLKYAEEHLRSIDDYFADAAAGTLPQFAFIDPNIGRDGVDTDDEHPPAMAPIGEALVASVVDALAKSPNWKDSALFLTYDEHGGLFDHVVPPKACPPDDLPLKVAPGDPEVPFDQLGIRVPMMVISPYAKKHHVSHAVYDHTSIVRFVEAKFVMPALSNRDANALAPWDMFDFDAAPHATPPEVTIPTVDADKLAACKAIFEK
ncbi:MAG: alkaline phosphatase family protein [Polyangiaceae bacterium]